MSVGVDSEPRVARGALIALAGGLDRVLLG
jgi:hypothetical protein